MDTSSLRYQYRTANVVLKLIAINAIIFIALGLLSWILGFSQDYLASWFVLPSDVMSTLGQPWSVLTYAFLHFSFWHIFWNMLVLYMFGRFVLNLFTEKRFLTIYLLGGIAGAFFFVLAYSLFPVLQGSRGYLIGASAAVNAIIVFIAAYTPNTPVRIIFFNVKLWQIGVFVVVMDLIQIPTSNNAGGLISHLGGALFGYVYARQLLKGNDIGLWWEKMLDSIAVWFKPRSERPAKMKTVHRSKTPPRRKASNKNGPAKTSQQQRVDDILDKISKSGYDSLSKSEKDFLFKAGKDS
ncbi:rhomboid family intramembrane serine protease [Croceiramulus getboli]|nr:rhomboid family intramembrane serine protease [Flavobacteriaceae bacterium YJPT1-3]